VKLLVKSVKSFTEHLDLTEDSYENRASGEPTGQCSVRLCTFSFARVRFCSEIISDGRIHIRMTSQAESLPYILDMRKSEIS
jgi:hypothetical protein